MPSPISQEGVLSKTKKGSKYRDQLRGRFIKKMRKAGSLSKKEYAKIQSARQIYILKKAYNKMKDELKSLDRDPTDKELRAMATIQSTIKKYLSVYRALPKVSAKNFPKGAIKKFVKPESVQVSGFGYILPSSAEAVITRMHPRNKVKDAIWTDEKQYKTERLNTAKFAGLSDDELDRKIERDAAYLALFGLTIDLDHLYGIAATKEPTTADVQYLSLTSRPIVGLLGAAKSKSDKKKKKKAKKSAISAVKKFGKKVANKAKKAGDKLKGLTGAALDKAKDAFKKLKSMMKALTTTIPKSYKKQMAAAKKNKDKKSLNRLAEVKKKYNTVLKMLSPMTWIMKKLKIIKQMPKNLSGSSIAALGVLPALLVPLVPYIPVIIAASVIVISIFTLLKQGGGTDEFTYEEESGSEEESSDNSYESEDESEDESEEEDSEEESEEESEEVEENGEEEEGDNEPEDTEFEGFGSTREFASSPSQEYYAKEEVEVGTESSSGLSALETDRFTGEEVYATVIQGPELTDEDTENYDNIYNDVSSISDSRVLVSSSIPSMIQHARNNLPLDPHANTPYLRIRGIGSLGSTYRPVVVGTIGATKKKKKKTSKKKKKKTSKKKTAAPWLFQSKRPWAYPFKPVLNVPMVGKILYPFLVVSMLGILAYGAVGLAPKVAGGISSFLNSGVDTYSKVKQAKQIGKK